MVDNGPAGQPSRPLVQVCLVGLINFLKPHKNKQVSSAEYYSQHNFILRLSKHGPFSSMQACVLQASSGSKEHRGNIQSMTDEIRIIVYTIQGSFGTRPLHAFH